MCFYKFTKLLFLLLFSSYYLIFVFLFFHLPYNIFLFDCINLFNIFLIDNYYQENALNIPDSNCLANLQDMT